MCGCTGEPGLCSAVLTRQSTETQHYAHCDLLSDLARQGDKVCGLHILELHSSDFVCFVCGSVWQCAHIGALSVCVCVLSLCVTWCVSVSADVLYAVSVSWCAAVCWYIGVLSV